MENRAEQKEQIKKLLLQNPVIQQKYGINRSDEDKLKKKEEIKELLLKNPVIQQKYDINNKEPRDKGFFETQAASNEYLKQKMGNSLLGLTDIPEIAVSGPSRLGPGAILGEERGKRLLGEEKYGQMKQEAQQKQQTPPAVSTKIKEFMRSQGMNTEGAEAQGYIDRIGGEILKFMAPAAVLGPAAGLESAATAGAMGAGSGLLQEAGVPEHIADITAVLTPAGVKGAQYATKGAYNKINPRIAGERAATQRFAEVAGEQNIPEMIQRVEQYEATPSLTGYKPMTQEIVETPGVSQIHRGFKGQPAPIGAEGMAPRIEANRAAVKESLEGLSGKEALSPEATRESVEALNTRHIENLEREIGPKHTAESAGEKIRPAIESEGFKRVKERSAKTKPEYEQLHHIEERARPESALSYIEEESKRHSDNGKLRGVLDHAKGLLEGEGTSFIEKGGKQVKMPHKIGVLESSIGELSDMAREAKKAGRFKEANILKSIESKVYDDLEGIRPDIKKIRANYREASKPVNELYDSPLFKSVLKKNKYETDYIMGASKIPKKIINTSEGSLDHAKEFKKIVGHDKDAMEGMRGYINSNILKEAISDEGILDLNKARKFIEERPGISVIYPELKTKVANQSNARAFFSKATKEQENMVNKHYQDALKTIVGKDSDKMAKNIFQSNGAPKKIEMLESELSHNPEAWEGFKRNAADFVGEHAETPFAFTKFFKNNQKALEKTFKGDGYKRLEEINNRLSKVLAAEKMGTAQGSPSVAYARMMKEFESSPFDSTLLEKAKTVGTIAIPSAIGVAHSPWLAGAGFLAGTAKELFNHYRRLAYKKTISDMITSPSTFKFMMNKYSKDSIKKANADAKKAILERIELAPSLTAITSKDGEKDEHPIH